MNLPIRDLLFERMARATGGRKALSFVAAVAVHVFIVLLVVLAPMLSATDLEPLQYVAVQIVPARMLGSSTPTPPQPQESPPQKPEPAEPEPTPEPEQAETPPKPVVPDPEIKRPKPQAPAPRRVETREAAPPGALSQREGSPTGSQLGTSNFGTAVGFDNPDFTYDYYVDRMLARIREHWVRPALGGSVEAMVHFRILKEGEVVDVSIARSSGYNSFDLAALRAVQSASPLPPLPQSFRHRSLGVNLVVR